MPFYATSNVNANQIAVICSHQFLRNVLVEDFLRGQGHDDFVAALEEGFDLLQGVRRIIERHEETFLAIFALHHGFKGVYVRATGLVFLFYLDGIPAFFQAEFAFLLFARGGTVAARRQTAANVYDMFQMAALCRDAATPIADDSAASGATERFAFRQTQTSRRRLAMARQAVGEISMPIPRLDFQGEGRQDFGAVCKCEGGSKPFMETR